jgi:hypothetical protein
MNSLQVHQQQFRALTLENNISNLWLEIKINQEQILIMVLLEFISIHKLDATYIYPIQNKLKKKKLKI